MSIQCFIPFITEKLAQEKVSFMTEIHSLEEKFQKNEIDAKQYETQFKKLVLSNIKESSKVIKPSLYIEAIFRFGSGEDKAIILVCLLYYGFLLYKGLLHITVEVLEKAIEEKKPLEGRSE